MSNPQDNTASILQKNKKVLIASLTGSAIEWFDYFLYGTAAALVFNKIFFPMVDPVICVDQETTWILWLPILKR